MAEEEVVRTPRGVTAKQPTETDKKNEKVSLGAYEITCKTLNKDSGIQNVTYTPTPPFKENEKCEFIVVDG